MTERFQSIACAQIDPNSDNIRLALKEIQELANLIDASGWVAPLVVQPKGSRYEVIAGDRRFAAVNLLRQEGRDRGRFDSLDCEIFEGSEVDILIRNAQENLGRQSITVYERAKRFQTLRDRLYLNQTQIAEKMGEDRVFVCKALTVLDKGHPLILKRLSEGHDIPARILFQLVTLRDKEKQLERFNQWLGIQNPKSRKALQLPTEEGASEIKPRVRREHQLRMLLMHLQDRPETHPETLAVLKWAMGIRATLPVAIGYSPKPRKGPKL